MKTSSFVAQCGRRYVRRVIREKGKKSNERIPQQVLPVSHASTFYPPRIAIQSHSSRNNFLHPHWSTSSPQNLPSQNQTTVSLSTQIRNERTHFNFKVHHSETNSTFFFSRHTMKPLLGFAIAFLLLLHSSLASDIPYPKAISVCSINLFIPLFKNHYPRFCI